MRLLEVKEDGTLSFTDKLYDNLPPYAILSHTWGRDADEVYYKDVLKDRAKAKLGYKKLELCAKWALRHGLRHFWIDTCCIKQGDSSEVSEAVNSMFRWYRESAVCYVYLADVAIPASSDADREVPPDVHLILNNYDPYNALRSQTPNWFKRGWTLQELIAPKVVKFYSQEGTYIGNKDDLSIWISRCTKLPLGALGCENLHGFSIKDRLTWAASRRTKRPEDRAYCLLGIFGIHMNLLYGEGQKNAFDRLERKVAKREREKSWRGANSYTKSAQAHLLQPSGITIPTSQEYHRSMMPRLPMPQYVQVHGGVSSQPNLQHLQPYMHGNPMLTKVHGDVQSSSAEYRRIAPQSGTSSLPFYSVVDSSALRMRAPNEHDSLERTDRTIIEPRRSPIGASGTLPVHQEIQADLLQPFDLNAIDAHFQSQTSSVFVHPVMQMNEMRAANTSGLTPPNPQAGYRPRAKSDASFVRSGDRGRTPDVSGQLEPNTGARPIAPKPARIDQGNNTRYPPSSLMSGIGMDRARSPSLAIDSAGDFPKRKRGRPTKQEVQKRLKESEASGSNAERDKVFQGKGGSQPDAYTGDKRTHTDEKSALKMTEPKSELPELGDGMMLHFLNRMDNSVNG